MMAFASTAAEGVLRARLGSPINPVPSGPRARRNNDKVLTFEAPNGHVLALDRKAKGKARIWFQPPEPRELDGVVLRPTSPINAYLGGRPAVLSNRQGLQVEASSATALRAILYRGGSVRAIRNLHTKLCQVGAMSQRLNPQEPTGDSIERQSAEVGSREYGASIAVPERLVA